MQHAEIGRSPRQYQKLPSQLRRRVTSWTMIAAFALLMLFLGSCPDGAMAGATAMNGNDSGWWYQCPIVRAVVPAE